MAIKSLDEADNTGRKIFHEVFGNDPNPSFDVIDMLNAIKFHYEYILSKIPQSLYWKDKNAVYLGCNECGANLVGLKKASDIVGLTDYDFEKKLNWAPGTADSFREDDFRVIERGEDILDNQEESFTTASGKPIYQLTGKIPLRNEKNEIIGVIGVSTDITELKKAKEETEIARADAEINNQLKTQFVQNMQHDLRTPIQSICSLVQNLLNTETDPLKKQLMSLLYEGSSAVLQYCNDILDLESIHYLDKTIKLDPTYVYGFLMQLVKLYKPGASLHEITIFLEIDPIIPTFLMIDKSRMKRILANLMGNAIKFTPKEGTITLRASCVKEDDEKVTVSFEIEDTGIGIEEKNIPYVFDRFTKFNPSFHGNYKGTGLGLYFVKKFVDDLSGHITIESKIGKGTCIKIQVDCPKLSQEEMIAEDKQLRGNITENISFNDLKKIMGSTSTKTTIPDPAISPPTLISGGTAYNVLVAEDDKVTQWVICDNYKSIGCTVVSVDSVAGAIKALSETPFNLVSCDLGLIDGEGFDIIDWAKSNKEHPNQTTPFIALSANTDSERVQKALQKGFKQVFEKPFLLHDLKRVVNKYLSRHNNPPDTIIDIANLLEDNQNNKKKVIELLTKVIGTFPEDKEMLGKFAREKNFEKTRTRMHNLKGMCSYARLYRLEYYRNILHDAIIEAEKCNEPLTSLSSHYDALFKEMDVCINEFSSLKDKENLQGKLEGT